MKLDFGDYCRIRFLHNLSGIARQIIKYSSVDFYKQWVFRGYLLYLILTYRLAKKPNKFITKKWPEWTGAVFVQESAFRPESHVSHSRALEKIHPFEVLQKTNPRPTREDLKFGADAQLIGLKFLILKSSRSIRNYHLEQLSISIQEVLGSLGGLCFTANTLDFPGMKTANMLDDFDFIICDQTITRGELEMVFENSSKILGKANKFKTVLLCYDLWREKDKSHIDSIQGFIDIFLHNDSIAMEKSFPRVVNKSFVWPLSRIWSCINVPSNRLVRQEDRIFFSGKASEYDRRQILDSVIDATRKTTLKPRFHLAFGQLPWLFEDTEKYKLQLKQNRCILSPAQKGKEHWIITGRTLDTLGSPNSGVLLQQEGINCRPLAKILTPYRDYLPFVNQGELREIINWCDGNTIAANQISQNGYSEIRKYFSPSYLSGIFLNC